MAEAAPEQPPASPPWRRTIVQGAAVFLAVNLAALAALVVLGAGPTCEREGSDCFGEGLAFLALLAAAPFALCGAAVAVAVLLRRDALPAQPGKSWTTLRFGAWMVGVATAVLSVAVFFLLVPAADPSMGDMPEPWATMLSIVVGPVMMGSYFAPYVAAAGWFMCAAKLAPLAFRRRPWPPAAAP